MAAHTPGPWRTEPDSFRLDDEEHSHVAGESICAKDYHIGYVAGCDDVDEANARLIAAAPELLAALRACEHRLLEYGHVVRKLDEGGEAAEWWANDGTEEEPGDYLNDEAWEEARAAIAKATEARE